MITTPIDPLWTAIVALLGLCVGSFLNVAIYRLPEEVSVVHPRSFCPHCHHPIAWHDNIPVLSWLLLGGKCRQCRQWIAWRYPLVELLTAGLFVWLFLWQGWGLYTVMLWSLTAALIVSTFIDFDYRIIPDEITLPGIGIGLLVSTLCPSLHGATTWWAGLGYALLGMLVGGGSLYLTGLLGNALFRKESMGGGDIKLLAMAGTVLGWQLVLVAFFLAPVLAVLPGLVVLMTTKSHEIPYGPFLSLALLISMVAGHAVLDYLGITEALAVGLPELRRWLESWWLSMGGARG